MLDVMNLPCAKVAARGHAVAVMADCKRQLNNDASVLAISDVIIDVFQCLRRRDLDMLQIVSVHFNAIVEKKMALVVGAGQTRLRTSVDDEAVAMTFLLNACRSSSVDSLGLFGTTPMGGQFFDALALSAPSIFLNEFRMGNRDLADGVAHDKVLRALHAFAELGTVTTRTCEGVELQVCLIRTSFRAGVALVTDGLSLNKKFDIAIVENALLEFCFGGCDEQYAKRDRFLCVKMSHSLKSDFLKRLIERAEVTDCRHKLTLDISFSQGLKPQDTRAMGGYKQDHQVEGERRFGSVSGRHWTSSCGDDGHGSEQVFFKINH
ncbi:hypothetical protein AAVH_23506 [Aphelenchoides avenae]|nr:hypothetical protein AAVH_23506 [Aphelenchus avenae]